MTSYPKRLLGFFSKTTRSLIKFLSAKADGKLRSDAWPYRRAGLNLFFWFIVVAVAGWSRKEEGGRGEKKGEDREKGTARSTSRNEKRKQENGRSCLPAGRRLNVLNNGKIYQATPTVFPKRHPSSRFPPLCLRSSSFFILYSQDSRSRCRRVFQPMKPNVLNVKFHIFHARVYTEITDLSFRE